MPPAKKQSVDVNFPIQGVVEGTSHSTQPPNTTPDAKNVVPFDVDEDRARGGRRPGVVKTTHSSISSSEIDFIGSVQAENTSTVKAVGGVSKFDDDHEQFPLHVGKLHLDNVTDGYEPLQHQLGGPLGHPWFCRSTTGMTWNKTNTLNDGDASWHSSHMSPNSRTLGVSPLYETLSYASNGPTYAKSIQMLGHNSGVLKTTVDGVPCLSLRPYMCPVHAGCDIGGAPLQENKFSWGEWIGSHADDNNNPCGSSNDSIRKMMLNNNCQIVFKKMISLMPLTEFDQHPWNSDFDKAYATNLTFKAPVGYTKVNGGEWDNSGTASSYITFVKSSAEEDVDDPSKIYDPYYIKCLLENDASAVDNWDDDLHKIGLRDSTFEGQSNYLGYGEEGVYRWGLVLRINYRSDYPTGPVSGTDYWTQWHNNTVGSWGSTGSEMDNGVICIYFEKDNSMTVGGHTTKLIISELRDATGTGNSAYETFLHAPFHGFNMQNEVVIDSEIFPKEDTETHTLQIRTQGQALSIYVDGALKVTYDDITDILPNLATPVASEDNTTSYSHSMFFYCNEYGAVKQDSASNTDADEKVLRAQMKYFGTFDWSLVGDSDGNLVTSSKTGSDELRLFNWDWREVNTTSSGNDSIVVVSDGLVYDTGTDDPGNFHLRSVTPDLSTNSRRIDGVSYFQSHYLLDGNNYKQYDSSLRAVSDWNADGDITLPGGDGSTGLLGLGTSDGNDRCTIIDKFMGRIVMSGKADEPQNWFMSAFGDPNDWAVDGTVELGGAVSGASGRLGELADPVTALAPSGDTRLIIGASNSMFAMTGDPSNPATSIVTLSRDIGIVGPDAWCYGPNKIMYFISENGLYAIQPNEYSVLQTNRLSSGKIDRVFKNLDYSSVHTRLVFDQTNHGIHIFLTPTRQMGEGQTHYYFDTRTSSFWPMEYPAVMGPTYVFDFKDPNPSARSIMLGGYDGHIRKFDATALDDDGTIISSHVWIGPIAISIIQETKLVELLAILDEQTPGLSYEVYAADTVEQAKSSSPVITGSWIGGRNTYVRSRARGAAIFIKLLDGTRQAPWALEKLSATLAVAGKARQR